MVVAWLRRTRCGRRQRRLRSWLRHERMTVAVALAEMKHHTAPRDRRWPGPGGGERVEPHGEVPEDSSSPTGALQLVRRRARREAACQPGRAAGAAGADPAAHRGPMVQILDAPVPQTVWWKCSGFSTPLCLSRWSTCPRSLPETPSPRCLRFSSSTEWWTFQLHAEIGTRSAKLCSRPWRSHRSLSWLGCRRARCCATTGAWVRNAWSDSGYIFCVSSRRASWTNSSHFLREGGTLDPQVDSCFSANMAEEEVAAVVVYLACIPLVLLVKLHLALCSPTIAAKSACTR